MSDTGAGRWESRSQPSLLGVSSSLSQQQPQEGFLLNIRGNEPLYHAKLLSSLVPIWQEQQVDYRGTDCTLKTEGNVSIDVHTAVLSKVWPGLGDILPGADDS